MSFLAYALILLVLVLGLYWVARRGRAPARGKKTVAANRARTPERVRMEKDLQARLERLKQRTDHVAEAVRRDPKRAANAVRAMMNDKN